MHLLAAGQRLVDLLYEEAWPALPAPWRNRYVPISRALKVAEGHGVLVALVFDLEGGSPIALETLYTRLEMAPENYLTVH